MGGFLPLVGLSGPFVGLYEPFAGRHGDHVGCDGTHLYSRCMTTTAHQPAASVKAAGQTTAQPAAQSAARDRGIFGEVGRRLAEGRKTGWGVFHAGSSSMFIGGLMLIVCSFLPWVIIPMGEETFSLRGTDGPGLATLALGFLAFAGAFIPKRRLAIAHSLIPGVLVGVLVGLQVMRLVQFSAATGSWGALLPGMGLVLAAGGAVILLRVGVRMWRATPAG